ncbi:short-chain dehydrogenase/reductase [Pseudohyphozyma bogoriensis]|nr:short-chain dehydrogenase/reductase [Pseudohyphozyma bogoriensis]
MASSVFTKDLYKGKVAFVTGGGSGICYGMVESLLAHGCKATILGRRKDVIEKSASELTRKTGSKCLGVSGDVRDPESLKKAVETTVKEFGKIDFVICGAAGNFLSPVAGMSENAFKTVMEIDTLGTFNTFKATIGEVKKTQGAYLAISATLHYRGTFLQAHVSAAKAAIDALFRVLAVEYGPFGVRVNVIAPGPIADTEGVARLLPKEPGLAEKVTKAIPLQRYGKVHFEIVEDIAEAGLFLFSPAASYITGTCLVVDGGEYHNGGQSRMAMYPEALFDTDFRKTIAAKL